MTAIVSQLGSSPESGHGISPKLVRSRIGNSSKPTLVRIPAVDSEIRRHILWNDDPTAGIVGKIGITALHLAHVDSIGGRKVAAPRWTEVDIYRTAGEGKYIFHSVGRSIVAHEISCPDLGTRKLPGFDRIRADRGDVAPDQRKPCPVCRPKISELLAISPASLAFEENRHTGVIFATAVDLVAFLDDVSEKRYTLTELAIKEASYVDPLVAQALAELNEVITEIG